VLTGDGKYLVVPNAIDSTVTIVDVASRTPVRTFPSVTNAWLAATFNYTIGPSKPVGPAASVPK
jgi:hypothetical protein